MQILKKERTIMPKRKIRELSRLLNPIDDVMFRKMAEHKEFCEEILRVILEDDNLTVTESRVHIRRRKTYKY